MTPVPATPAKKRLFSQGFRVAAALLVFVAGVMFGVGLEQRRHGLDMGKFWAAYDIINSDYVRTPDDNELIDGAISGLLSGLDDPYSSYFSTEEKNSFNDDLSGKFEGIGAELTEKNGAITVVAPLSGSPAERAGLRASDVVAEVNGKSTEGLTVDEAVKQIRGEKGTEVTLKIIRGTDEPFELKIIRDTIVVKSVEAKMLGRVSYIEISQFGDDTVTLMAEAIIEAAGKNAKAVILDLRNNPGGYLNSVPPIAGHFVAPSVIVKERYRDGKTDELRSAGVPELPTTPLFILINGGSASASEILAGALQDYGRATIVGEKSFGKGSVQELIDLPGNTAIRLTIAEWLTPKDRAIDKVGITPDVEVKDEKTDANDPVLNKALELANK